MARRLFPQLVAGLLVLALGPLAPTPARGQADDVIGNIQAEQEHLAKGELQYGTRWVHIKNLFEEYGTGRKEGQAVIEKGRALIARLGELQRQALDMRVDEETKERPTRDELGRARARQTECKRILAATPPVEPTAALVPPEPQRSAFADDEAYNKAHKEWEQKRAGAERDPRRQEQYQRDLERFRQGQAQASKDLKTAEETIARCEKTLEGMRAELQTRLAPVVKQHAETTQEAQGIGRQANEILHRMALMGNILRKAPEGLRLQYGILEWDSLFRPLSEAETIYQDTQAEIDRGREKALADATKAGRTLPANWRHPRENDLKALKNLIEHAKAAQKPPAPPEKKD